MQRRLVVVAVALLAALAGCNTFVSPDDEPDEPASTVTPVPIETTAISPKATVDSAAQSPSSFAGITERGTVDERELFGSHQRYLSNRSYTFRRIRQSVGDGESVSGSYDALVAVENETTFRQRESGSETAGTVATYADPSGQYSRVERPNGSTVTGAVPRDIERPRQRFARITSAFVGLLFEPRNFEIDVVERDGRRYARLYSRTAPEYLVSVYGDYTVRNFTSTIWIAPEGYIRTFHYEFDLHDPDGHVHVDLRYSYADVGETTVAEPGWVTDLERTETVKRLSFTVTGNGRDTS